MRKNLGGFGTLLVLGLGLGLLRNGAAPGAKSSSTPAASQRRVAEDAADKHSPREEKCSKVTCPEKDLFDAVTSFFPNEASGKNVGSLVQDFQRLTKGNEIDFAIAIVPDPRHTHLSLFFDRTIDAIQQGAQQAGLIFDRATMPWESEEHHESTDFRIRLQQEDYQRDKEELPGLMIFRRANPATQEPNTPLFVFVVGETPTGGISKDQFHNALALIYAVARDRKPLRIIGPTFSGSLYSLSQLLQHPPSPNPQFTRIVVRSGTISSWDTMQWFQQQCFDDKLSVDFATFQQSDRYLLRSFVEFEKRRGYSPTNIAVLAEDETAYGNRQVTSATSVQETSKQSPCPGGAKASKIADTDDDPALRADEDSVLQLYFPRDISQLRSAYQQGFQQNASSSTDAYQVRTTLPLTLQDTGSNDDTVQQYAHSQTPLSQESILLAIVAAMRERHIQFVLLQATNPMDTLFLSAFLRKGYSDARVVAMPADLLLSRDADDVSLLHGVMALTTYSLLPDIDEEIAVPVSLPEGVRASHVFPNAYSVGTYNATLSQIMCIGWSSDQPPDPACKLTNPPTDLPEARYAEYGQPSLGGAGKSSKPLAPGVWLTVLGRGGFWPMAILDNDKAGNVDASPLPIRSSQPPCLALHPDQPSCCIYKYDHDFEPPWPVWWGIVCGFVLTVATVYWLLLRKGSIFASSSAMTMLAPVDDPYRSALIVVIGCLLLTAALLLSWPWFTWAGLGRLSMLRAAIGIIAVLLLCIGLMAELTRRKAIWARAIFIACAVVLFAGFALIYFVGRHSQSPFLYRYIHLTSGVSPLLPFLCLLAAGLWWAWFSLSGLALVDKRHPRIPTADSIANIAASGHTAETIANLVCVSEKSAKKIGEIARPAAWDSRVYGWALSVLVVTLFAFDRGHPVLSLETRHFEWIYAIALGVVTFALFSTLSRLFVVWLECRKIVSALDRFPLRRAFAQLNLTWEPIWRLGGGRWQDLYRLVSRQLETSEQLRRHIESEDDDLAKDLVESINKIAREEDEIRREFAQSRPASGTSDHFVDRYKSLQEKIAETCAAALKYLQPKWWEDEGLILSEIGSGEDVKKDDESPDLSLSTRLAERFVALVYLNFVLTVLLRMRTLAITACGVYIFLLLSVNSYPFEPKIALRSLAILMLMFVVGMVGYVSAQVHRDSILSLVTQTKPGELGGAFWLRMGAFVALPLLSLLVSQFPTLNNAVFSWLEPAVNALK